MSVFGVGQKTVTIIVISAVVGMSTGLLGGVLGSWYGPELALFFDVSVPHIGQSSSAVVLSPQLGNVDNEELGVTTVKRVSPSVVSIIIKKDLSKIYGQTGNDPFPFDNFFNFGFPFGQQVAPPVQRSVPQNQSDTPPEKQSVGGGSGFIISADGLILTNKHVVADVDAEYVVVTSDGKESVAKVLAKDPINDLAIIKIDAKGLVPLELGDSDRIDIGQTVIAIGNTLGEYKNTVTKGVVSGINRVVQAGDGMGATEIIQEAIQTDAAINPGNSGGPLLNLNGQVIGINTAVNSSGQSIGFAIPINVAKRSVESVKQSGRIVRPWLGIRYQVVDKEMAKINKLSVDYGALIQGNSARKELGVIAGSPAAKAGLGDGDIILEVEGQKIEDGHGLANEIAKYSPGTVIELKVLSRGQTKIVSVMLEEFKEDSIPTTTPKNKK